MLPPSSAVTCAMTNEQDSNIFNNNLAVIDTVLRLILFTLLKSFNWRQGYLKRSKIVYFYKHFMIHCCVTNKIIKGYTYFTLQPQISNIRTSIPPGRVGCCANDIYQTFAFVLHEHNHRGIGEYFTLIPILYTIWLLMTKHIHIALNTGVIARDALNLYSFCSII